MPSHQLSPAPERRPWNKGRLIGQKRPLKPKDVWAIRIRMTPSAYLSKSKFKGGRRNGECPLCANSGHCKFSRGCQAKPPRS